MMKRREKLLMGFVISLVVVLFFSAKAMAVPSYGVATGGTYYGDGSDPFESYQEYFASGFVSGGGPAHGFGFDVGSSSVTLSVFTNEANVDTWLMAEGNFGNNALTFGTLGSFTTTLPFAGNGPGGKIGSYDLTYLGVKIGTALDNLGVLNVGWAMLPSDPFNPRQFYVYEAELTFGVGLTAEDLYHYFFSVGDVDGSGVINGGEFSPKTTGAVNVPVPEPTTILLLGIGLVGLAGGAARRKFKKNNKQ